MSFSELTEPSKKKSKIFSEHLSHNPSEPEEYIWNFFPASFFSKSLQKFLLVCPLDMKKRLDYIKYCKITPYEGCNSEFWFPELSIDIEDACFEIQKVKGIMKRLLHRWKASKLTTINSTDFVTLEPIRTPVRIVDWEKRKCWAFEASSLMRDLTECLQKHDGFFEDPKFPRNPLTNSPLTLTQTLSVWFQLSSSNVNPSAAFCNFRMARWNLKNYKVMFSTILKYRSFKITMNDLKHEDSFDRLMDFITMVHDENDVPFLPTSYSYCIVNFPHSLIISAWRRLCSNYYFAEILYFNQPDTRNKLQDTILLKAKELLSKYHEICRIVNTKSCDN